MKALLGVSVFVEVKCPHDEQPVQIAVRSFSQLSGEGQCQSCKRRYLVRVGYRPQRGQNLPSPEEMREAGRQFLQDVSQWSQALEVTEVEEL